MTISEIQATTWEYRVKKPADAVADNTPLLFKIRKNGGWKVINGGRVIYENIRIAQNQYVQYIDPIEEITLGYNPTITAFEFAPKIIVTPVVISDLERAQNQGDAAFEDLLDERNEIADESTMNVVEASLQGDGTGYGGKAFAGIRSYIVDSTGTGSIGGVSRVTYPAIRNASVNAVSVFGSATTSSNIESRLRYMGNLVQRNTDSVDLLLLGQTYFNAGSDSFSGKQRITTDEEMYKAGFKNYIIDGMTACLAGGKIFSGLSHIAADRGYGLNTKTFNFKVYKGYNFQPQPQRVSINQLVEVSITVAIGNLTINNPGLNFVMYDS